MKKSIHLRLKLNLQKNTYFFFKNYFRYKHYIISDCVEYGLEFNTKLLPFIETKIINKHTNK